MRILATTIALAALSVAPAAGLAAEQVCYECFAKACYDHFAEKAGAINQQLDEDLSGVERQLAEMQLAAAQKAEVQGATEAVLQGNADRRKKLAYESLGTCLAGQ